MMRSTTLLLALLLAGCAQQPGATGRSPEARTEAVAAPPTPSTTDRRPAEADGQGVANVEPTLRQQVDPEESERLADHFAECAALFDAFFELKKLAGDEKQAQLWKDERNNARIATYMVARQTRTEAEAREYVIVKSEEHSDRISADILDDGFSPGLRATADGCAATQDIQHAIAAPVLGNFAGSGPQSGNTLD